MSGVSKVGKIRKIARKTIMWLRKTKSFYILSIGYFLNEISVKGQVFSRKIINSQQSVPTGYFNMGLESLHRNINVQIEKQRKEYKSYRYFLGYPYQSLAILGIYGDRSTEDRFESYGLINLVDKEDCILDIGCNCGFMGIYTAFRTGCKVDGIDINPYMIKIGELCAKYLGLERHVNLKSGLFQDFDAEKKYSVVFSFATHWTDDENYRIGLEKHLMKIYELLKPEGKLIFESHSADVGNNEFYETMEKVKTYYEWSNKLVLENGTRELYVMVRK